MQKFGPRRTMPGRERWARRLGNVFIVGLTAVIIVLRFCHMDAQRDDSLERAIAALSEALQTQTDLDDVVPLFEQAARHAMQDPYAPFCLAAVEELAGTWVQPDGVAPPEGWAEALTAIRQNRLTEALEEFEGLVIAEDSPFFVRRRSYVVLVGTLIELQALEGV